MKELKLTLGGVLEGRELTENVKKALPLIANITTLAEWEEASAAHPELLTIDTYVRHVLSDILTPMLVATGRSKPEPKKEEKDKDQQQHGGRHLLHEEPTREKTQEELEDEWHKRNKDILQLSNKELLDLIRKDLRKEKVEPAKLEQEAQKRKDLIRQAQKRVEIRIQRKKKLERKAKEKAEKETAGQARQEKPAQESVGRAPAVPVQTIITRKKQQSRKVSVPQPTTRSVPARQAPRSSTPSAIPQAISQPTPPSTPSSPARGGGLRFPGIRVPQLTKPLTGAVGRAGNALGRGVDGANALAPKLANAGGPGGLARKAAGAPGKFFLRAARFVPLDVWFILILMLLFAILVWIFASMILVPGLGTGGTGGGGTSCTTSDASGFNLFDKDAVTDVKLQAFIDKYKPAPGDPREAKFTERARYIRDTAQEAGFNPALFLALWRGESGFSSYGTGGVVPGNDLGCTLKYGRPSDPDEAFKWGVRCVVGLNPGTDNTCKSDAQNIATAVCARSQDASSEACRCISDIHGKFKGQACYQEFNIPIKTMDDYLQGYGSVCFDPNNINEIRNAPKLALEIAGTSTTTCSGLCVAAGASSCPIKGEHKVTTGTLLHPENGSGHCGPGYPSGFPWCSPAHLDSTPTSKASYALDVAAAGGTEAEIQLPFISGQSISWTLRYRLPLKDIGSGLDFQGKSQTNQEYYLHLYHLDPGYYDSVIDQPGIPSGTVVAHKLFSMSGPHVHFTVATKDSSGEWQMIEPDFTLHMCDNTTPATGGTSASPPTATVKTIVLDPGHSSPDLTYEGKSEEGALNFAVAQRLKTKLEGQGYTVHLTHDTPQFPINDFYSNLLERNVLVNGFNPNFFVAIHFDAGKYGFSGPRAFINKDRPFSTQNEQLGAAVAQALEKSTGLSTGRPVVGDTEAGSCKSPLYVLGPEGAEECSPGVTIREATRMPGTLMEFLTDGRSYTSILEDAALLDKIVNGYADGINQFASGASQACTPGTTGGSSTEKLPAPTQPTTITKGNNGNSIALTFDLGEGKYGTGGWPQKYHDNTKKILDTLKEKSVKATMFLTGAFIEDPNNKDLIEQMLRDGHEIGNHSDDHKSATGLVSKTTRMSAQELKDQIGKTESLFQARFGQTTKPFFRFPFFDGADDAEFNNAIFQEGYYNVFWTNCTPRDGTNGPAIEALAEYGSSNFASYSQKYVENLTTDPRCTSPGSQIVVHGYPDLTTANIGRVIDVLQSKGITVTNISGFYKQQ